MNEIDKKVLGVGANFHRWVLQVFLVYSIEFVEHSKSQETLTIAHHVRLHSTYVTQLNQDFLLKITLGIACKYL